VISSISFNLNINLEDKRYTNKKITRQLAIETSCEVLFKINGKINATIKPAVITETVFFKIKNKKLLVKNCTSFFFAKKTVTKKNIAELNAYANPIPTNENLSFKIPARTKNIIGIINPSLAIYLNSPFE
jgi:hypothetical protein